MKRFLCTLAIGVAAWALPGAVNAADVASKTVAVPFAFKVDHMTFPAGPYRVEQNFGKPVMSLVNLETGRRALIVRENVNVPGRNMTLTFERTEDGYKLSGIS